MEIKTNVTPPVSTNQRSYAALTKALSTCEGWLAVAAADVAGKTSAVKQTAINAACSRAGLKIETRSTPTHIYVRVIPSTEVQ